MNGERMNVPALGFVPGSRTAMSFAKLRDGAHLHGNEIRALRDKGAVYWDPLSMGWKPTDEALAIFNQLYPKP